MADATLKPCPFCGGEAEIIESDYGMYITGYAVYCRGKCHMKLGVSGRLGEVYEWIPVFDTEAEAIEAWNTRTPEQAIAATLGKPKAKSHPYGYERDTGAYDCTRCECGCINDISATYCNDCGGEIEIDESAEKEYYDGYSKHTVFAKKHDDGSLEFCERRYVPEDAARIVEVETSHIDIEQGEVITRFVPAELDYIDDKSRWAELFGTPERAARTLVENHERQATCLYCIMADRPGNPCGDGDYDALLGWLRGDAE